MSSEAKRKRLLALQRWLRRASWDEAAKNIDPEEPLPQRVSDGHLELLVDIDKGRLACWLGPEKIADEDGAYALRPFRRRGPAPMDPDRVTKPRTVYLDDDSWEKCAIAGEGSASSYVRALVYADLEAKGLR